MNRYLQEANRIITLIKKEFILDDGSLCLKKNYLTNVKLNKKMWLDLGDWLPFFFYFKEDDFIINQMNLLDLFLKNNLLVSEFETLKIRNLYKSYEYSDFLLGLLDHYLENKSDKNLKNLLFHVDKSIEIFNFDKKINSFYNSKFKFKIPIVDSRDGMFIEIFIEIFRITKNKKYLEVSKNIFNELISSSFYKKYNLLPTFFISNKLVSYLLRSKKFKIAEICKANTNSLYGFLNLYIETGDENIKKEIDKIINKIKNISINGGGVIKTFYPNNKKSNSFLTSSFSILDFLCDFYFITGTKKYLNFAKKIADYWLDLQSKKINLFPLYDNSKIDFLDSETDMSVALIKLYELTNENRYKDSAERCLEAIINFHGKYNYVSSINVENGKMVNPTQKTKFLALFLKLLILKIEYLKGEKIYSNVRLFNLLKDR
jgi:rhamnogalacturonyl hydrolase YesR